MRTVYLGRQPIFNSDLKPVAYELLYRAGDTDHSDKKDARASANVLINAFLEMGVQRVIGKARAFIHVTPEILDDDLLRLFDPAQLVLELMPDVAFDDALLASLDRLRTAGYGIAVDDLLVHEGTLPLLERAHFVKVDLAAVPASELAEHVTALRRFPAALVAEKVETHEQFAQCQALGFDFYQGYFFARPKLVAGRTMSEDRLSVLQLLAILHSPQSELSDVQAVIQQSVSLSYRLLRYANSAAFNLQREVSSIAQATVVLGQRRLRDLATLLALTGMSDKPPELTHTVLARARLCASLAPPGRGNADTAFTVGLFSGLDALMDRPLTDLLADLPLAEETRLAVLEQQGPFGQVLAAALALERGDFGNVVLDMLDPKPTSQAYLEAVDWANQTIDEMQAA
ncbi:MAG: EAL and HDOD domain-containing protein [Gammaproteobacteria bacterium]